MPGATWIRGNTAGVEIERIFKTLPFTSIFHIVSENLLIKIGDKVPSGMLPPMAWISFNRWLRIEFPSAALAAETFPTLELKLVRSADEKVPSVLLTRLEEWQKFISTASQIRISPLRFASNGGGEIVIQGNPLPSLPGKRFYTEGQIAIPLGFTWHPAVSATVFTSIMNAGKGVLVLWENEQVLREIKAEQFVPASRSAVRMTEKAAHA